MPSTKSIAQKEEKKSKEEIGKEIAKPKIGRPLLEISEELVFDLASIMCTNEEIAVICKCSKDTLEKRFSATLKEGRENGKSTLRRWQWNACRKGNPALLIWMGKQHLGQRDKHELDQIFKEVKIEISKEDENL